LRSIPAPKPATTPIPVHLSEDECTAFLLPHLAMPKWGPKCTLGYHRVFNLICGGVVVHRCLCTAPHRVWDYHTPTARSDLLPYALRPRMAWVGAVQPRPPA